MASPREKILSTKAYSPSARRWLYVGVGCVLTAMLGLWGYATVTELSFFDWGNTLEARLFKNTKQQFDALVKDNPILDQKVKERVKEAAELGAGTETFPVSPAVAGTTTAHTTTTVKR